MNFIKRLFKKSNKGISNLANTNCEIEKSRIFDLPKINIKTIEEESYFIEKMGDNYYPNGPVWMKNTLKYDEKGNKLELTVFYSDGLVASKEIYNEFGNIIEDIAYTKGSGLYPEKSAYKLGSKSVHKYDDKENEIEFSRYDSDGVFIEKTTFKCDENGNKIECFFYDSDNVLESKETHKYDKNGNEIEYCSYDQNGVFEEKTTFKNNQMGNLIECNIYDSENVLESKETYEYNDFDEKGNWIKRTKFEDNIPKLVTNRNIEYF